MSVEFYAVGGKIRVQEQAVAKEMLLRDSLLRAFILAAKSGRDRMPKVEKVDPGGFVTIDFSDAEVLLPGMPEEVFAPLKRRYGGMIFGRVTCVMKYEMMMSAYYTRFDLGPEPER